MRDALSAEGLESGVSETQILPVVVGDPRAAMEACERALAQGVFCQAIRPPTVADGSSRLRVDGDGLAHALRAALGRRGHRPRGAGRGAGARDAAGRRAAGRPPERGSKVFDGLAEAA